MKSIRRTACGGNSNIEYRTERSEIACRRQPEGQRRGRWQIRNKRRKGRNSGNQGILRYGVSSFLKFTLFRICFDIRYSNFGFYRGNSAKTPSTAKIVLLPFASRKEPRSFRSGVCVVGLEPRGFLGGRAVHSVRLWRWEKSLLDTSGTCPSVPALS